MAPLVPFLSKIWGAQQYFLPNTHVKLGWPGPTPGQVSPYYGLQLLVKMRSELAWQQFVGWPATQLWCKLCIHLKFRSYWAYRVDWIFMHLGKAERVSISVIPTWEETRVSSAASARRRDSPLSQSLNSDYSSSTWIPLSTTRVMLAQKPRCTVQWGIYKSV